MCCLIDGPKTTCADFDIQPVLSIQHCSGQNICESEKNHVGLFLGFLPRFHLLSLNRFPEIPGVLECNNRLRYQTGAEFEVRFGVGNIAWTWTEYNHTTNGVSI